ncbi:hypothetical protein P691DRAFT_661180 [Macrolepiota fuliginosa MF-IS2]|uniref:Ornithine decarboxylase antizyme n=1 Tax=Macrolepiota fuliginosa MF-IS2 TaxID=1400762 RepID=A0A9P5XMC0_9AGAR|nr:hypothetical protein P691DRAFT_661180 [Macrolepiota fuliginosa MF-IS2]
MSNFTNQQSSLRPANARRSVGDGAASLDTTVPSVLAVCHLEGNSDMYYYSTTFSGGPGVSPLFPCQASLKTDRRFFGTLCPSSTSGAFDVPNSKCPPDRGSSDCVTGSPASCFSSPSPSFCSSPTSSFSTSPTSSAGTRANISTISTPRTIPALARSGSSASSGFSTPPLTPDDGSYSSGGSFNSISLEPPGPQSKDALDYLMTIFPKDGLGALPYSKRVSVSAPTLDAAFEGIVLELPGKPKTLYVDGKNAASVSLRESIVALLDLASESLDCNALVIVLERSAPNLGELLHSLMYVGGSVVTKPPFAVDAAFVLVGLEI